MSALDSLYGGGIAAQGIGQGLQGLVEGYKLKRELDNQALLGQSMAGYRNMMGNAAGERGAAAEARAALLQEQLSRLQNGQNMNGAQPAGKSAGLPPGVFSDPTSGQMFTMTGGKPTPFQIGAPTPAAAPQSSPAAPPQSSGIMSMLGNLFGGQSTGDAQAKIASTLGMPAQGPAANNPAGPAQLQPAGGAPGAPGAAGANTLNPSTIAWMNSKVPPKNQPGQ